MAKAKITLKAIFIALLFVGLVFASGCKKKTYNNEGKLEILKIDNCSTDNESLNNCCQNQCENFCIEKGMKMAKFYDNAQQCACWCG